jgi:RNA polymerase sigma-70 factor (ECF subfamily)
MNATTMIAGTMAGEAAEAALLASARGGDAQAFGDLVKLHQNRVYRFVLKQLGQREIAREITQETFLQAYSGLSRFRAEARFTTWLIGIALNLTRQHLRGGAARGLHFEYQEDETRGSAFTDPANIAQRNAALNALQGAIDALPADIREPLVLVALEGLGYEDAAELLQIPLGTVKSRINRARSDLKGALQEHDWTAFSSSLHAE